MKMMSKREITAEGAGVRRGYYFADLCALCGYFSFHIISIEIALA
jgi:hypothetical protein